MHQVFLFFVRMNTLKLVQIYEKYHIMLNLYNTPPQQLHNNNEHGKKLFLTFH